jgi:protein SCO1/2
MKPRHLLLFGFAILVGLVGAYLLLGQTREYTFHGSLIDPPVMAPQINLTDVDGGSFELSDLNGQVVIMFFGYTSCPDVCPVTLSDFLRVRTQLGKEAEEASFVFITVDPERDSPERMKKYLTNFDPEIIGLTGSRSELQTVWSSYGVYQAKSEGSSEENYLVDHSSRIYVIDKAGNLLLTYLFGTENNLIADDVRYLISNQSVGVGFGNEGS